MARYNAWQNNQLTPILNRMDVDALLLERGAFFGSILGTLNHLLWGDMLWLNSLTSPRLHRMGMV